MSVTTPSTSGARQRPDALADAIRAAALDALGNPDEHAEQIVQSYAVACADAIRARLPEAVAAALTPGA